MPLHRTSSGPALPQAISSMMHQAQSSPRNHHKHALRIVFALGVLLLLLSGWSSRSNQFDELENDHELEFYSPESLQEVQEITYDERMHLAMLHEGCMTHRDSVITSDFGHKEDKDSRIGRFQQDDPNLRMKLEDCPDVEVLLPIYLRGDGYCEDAMAYVKYLQGRALPEWVFDVKFIEEGKTLTYHDLCPKTSMIFLNHFWDGLLNQSSWPAIKPVYLMPNIEMYELEAHHYWRADVVLCKTAICARRVRMWYQQEGNPRHTRVLYTRHTTSDAALQAMQQFKVNGVLPAKNFSNLHFVHTAGNSVFKGTHAILDCWLARPAFPPLDIFMTEAMYEKFLSEDYHDKLQHQPSPQKVTVHTGRVPGSVFGRMMIETAFMLCTSVVEGYGHYINQARANGALIVSTDAPPMNELLSPASAILVPHRTTDVEKQLLGGTYAGAHGLRGVKGMAAYANGADICNAIERIVDMSPLDRQRMGERAQKQYLVDTHFFAARMTELRSLARAGCSVVA